MRVIFSFNGSPPRTNNYQANPELKTCAKILFFSKLLLIPLSCLVFVATTIKKPNADLFTSSKSSKKRQKITLTAGTKLQSNMFATPTPPQTFALYSPSLLYINKKCK